MFCFRPILQMENVLPNISNIIMMLESQVSCNKIL